MKPLGEVCDVEWGNTSLTKKAFVENGKFLAVSAAGMDGRIDHSEHAAMIPVISAIGANCGRMFLPEEPFTAVKNTMTVTPHLGLDSRFVFFGLSSIELPRRGAAQPFLALGDIRKIPFQIPPLEEQERIVEVLDEAFAAIDKAKANIERNLTNARELFQSRLNDIFSNPSEDWEVKLLGEVCENLDSKRVPITKSKRVSGETPYYGASGVVDWVEGYIFDEDLLLISEDGANLLARTYPIAFSISGKTWVNNHAHVLRFENPNHQLWVQYYINSISVESFVSGMAQPKLNQKKLNQIPIPVPSLFEQERIVGELDTLMDMRKNLEVKYQCELDNLEELRQSILEQAFEGKLTEPAAA
jgi:type I restriction enzyme S subunit